MGDKVVQVEGDGNLALNTAQTATLFGRLSVVFGRPASELCQAFLRSSDAEFAQLRISLQSQLVVHDSKDTSNGHLCNSSIQCQSRMNIHESSSVDDPSHAETVSSRGYTRPPLPPPVPPGDTPSDDYLSQLTDALKYALSFRDSACVQDIALQCPRVVTSLGAEDLSAVLHSELSYNSLHCLLQDGADANTFDKFGSTLLHRYISDQNLEFTKLLLKI